MKPSMSPRFHAAACCSRSAVIAAVGAASAACNMVPAVQAMSAARKYFFIGSLLGQQIAYGGAHGRDRGFHRRLEDGKEFARMQRGQRRAGALAFCDLERIGRAETEEAERHFFRGPAKEAEIFRHHV